MLRRHALIRKLPAVETLGSVTVICSDKTGTLTQNRMHVTTLDVAGDRIDVTERLHDGEQEADARIVAEPSHASHDQALRALLASAALCCDAQLADGMTAPETPGEYHVTGDPTEGAIVVAAAGAGLSKLALDAAFPRVGEAPFDAARKRMTTVHRFPAERTDAFSSCINVWIPPGVENKRGGAGRLIVCKGAVSAVLEACTAVYADTGWATLSASWRARILQAEKDLAGSGMRVLGVAFGARPAVIDHAPPAQIERDLTFAGLVGLVDPARPEAKAAMATCRSAGIRPIMITGDHPLTATVVGEELGMTGGRVVTGRELLAMPATSLAEVVETVSVYARVAPEDKLAIVKALQDNGEIVAMTGDGVNDAPALKKADIGVAMGLSGTDVAKDAADMVLLDDNFATIVAAVEEGRVIYDNIRKFVRYLLATNSGELWIMLLYPLIGLPLPLAPLQILWINLVTDGLPALALSAEPAERDTMRRPPRPPTESLFARGLGWHVLWVGLLISGLCLGGGLWLRLHGVATWQTLLFTTLAFTQMAHVLAIRTEHDSVFRSGFWTNRALIGAVGLTVALQLAVVYLPPLQAVFGARALAPSELALSLGLSAVVFGAVEFEKWLRRRAEARNTDANHA
jgi:Ca2+-transporting ATPase